MTKKSGQALPETVVHIRHTLQTSEMALGGGEAPLIVYRHGRWHFVTLGFVSGFEMEMRTGIVGINFMSEARAVEWITEESPYTNLITFDEAAPYFRQELAYKVLPVAEEYRPLLRNGLVEVVIGYTTDTLRSIGYDEDYEDALVAAIQMMMAEGGMGPFLHFEYAWEVIADKCRSA